jgi:hypothetical protein
MSSESVSISDSTHRWHPAFPAIRVGGGGPDLAIFSSIAIFNIDHLKLATFEFNRLVIGRAARIRYCDVRPLLHHHSGAGPTPAVQVLRAGDLIFGQDDTPFDFPLTSPCYEGMGRVEPIVTNGLVKRDTSVPMRPDLVEALTVSIRKRPKERRQSPRKDALRVGYIVYGCDRRLMHCVLLNISDGGAKFGPADIHNCPDRFFLQIADQALRDCKVL